MPFKDPVKAREFWNARDRRVRATPEGRKKHNEVANRSYHNNRTERLARYSPAKHREYRLLREYGLTVAAWDALFDGQGRRCAICETTDPGTSKGWHTDHDHETGRVRGILCKSCNTSLGLLGDTQSAVRERVARIEDYLR